MPDFSQFGQLKTAIKVLPTKPRPCCSTLQKEPATALSHRGVMVNSHLQHPQAAIRTAKTGMRGGRGSYTIKQFENRPKLQIPASEIRPEVPVLSFPALFSSLRAWKRVMPGKNGSQSSVLKRQSWNFCELTYKTVH